MDIIMPSRKILTKYGIFMFRLPSKEQHQIKGQLVVMNALLEDMLIKEFASYVIMENMHLQMEYNFSLVQLERILLIRYIALIVLLDVLFGNCFR